MTLEFSETLKSIADCHLCQDRFAATKTCHEPRPIVWLNQKSPILIAGQAPGARVQESGVPFDDSSGDRLRDWMGVSRAEFYTREKVSILPMSFCFPGYNDKGSDLPPPPLCRKTWHIDLLQHFTPKLTMLVGGYAQKFHLGAQNGKNVTNTVLDWRTYAPSVFPLPHPSWRNTAWIKKNPWFENDLLPALRKRVKEVLKDD